MFPCMIATVGRFNVLTDMAIRLGSTTADRPTRRLYLEGKNSYLLHFHLEWCGQIVRAMSEAP